MSHNYLLADKSMPLVGSSSKTNLESPHKAIATDNLRLFPPES